MNENQENKNPEVFEPAKEPLTKRLANFSAFIYLGLAIAVVITATVGIFSISYDYEDTLSAVSIPELNLGMDEVSTPQFVITPDDILSEAPVVNEESGIGAGTEPEPTYYSPVSGEVIKPFSIDALVFSETMQDYRIHSGIDIAASIGTKVVAYTDGVVSLIKDDYFYGTTVAITHDKGVVSYYMNLAPELAEDIAVGNEVVAGQVIGEIGTTARAENADPSHLHFEIKVEDALINPEPELP